MLGSVYCDSNGNMAEKHDDEALSDVEKIKRQGHALLCTPSDVDTAIGMLAELMTRGWKIIVVRNPGTSRAAMERLNKWARKNFYVSRVDGGFIVHPSQRK